jgi:Uma2 family endonuclease
MKRDDVNTPHTSMETYKMLPEGTLVELIDNVVYDSPSPVYGHQSISKIILHKLIEEVEYKGKGEVFHAPFDVYLDEIANAVQPDLIVVLKDNLKIIDRCGHIHGVPDLLIEILSKSNKKHHLIRKKKLYERFGVTEYWIIDPETKQTIGFELKDGHYTSVGGGTGLIKSNLLQLSIVFDKALLNQS